MPGDRVAHCVQGTQSISKCLSDPRIEDQNAASGTVSLTFMLATLLEPDPLMQRVTGGGKRNIRGCLWMGLLGVTN